MMKRLLLLVISCYSGPEFLYPDDPRLHSDKWYERPWGYPQRSISKILRNESSSISKFFNARKEEDELISSFLNTRLLGDDYENICDEETHFIYPRKGTNKKGENMFIVNEADTEYRQLVRITRCQGAEEPCSNADIDSSYITKCVQEYSDIKLVALSENGEELIVETFQFPSCCICKVRNSLFLRSAKIPTE